MITLVLNMFKSIFRPFTRPGADVSQKWLSENRYDKRGFLP